MKQIYILIMLLATLANADYLDSKSCNECHENIYAEHVKSMHHNSSLFKDEVHRKVKEMTTPDKYDCALCHMPATGNLAGMLRGMHQPNPDDVRQQDGVSCFYCHQISNVYHNDSYNINFSSYHEGEKPTFFGNLENAEDSDKHKAAKNPIYKNSEVCMGCHSHKKNKFDVQICNTQNEYNATSNCIGCHMPKRPGNVEKFNKRGRSEYASHKFLGIHSEEMVKEAVKLELQARPGGVTLHITNRMGHSVITHPMRLKFVKTVVTRDGKPVWSNFKESPVEDKEATFIVVFKDAEEKPTMPPFARGYKLNRNLKAMGVKTVEYAIEGLQKGDTVTSTWVSYILNPGISKKLEITDETLTKPVMGQSVSITIP